MEKIYGYSSPTSESGGDGLALLSSILIQISSSYKPQIKGLDLIRFRVDGMTVSLSLIELIEA